MHYEHLTDGRSHEGTEAVILILCVFDTLHKGLSQKLRGIKYGLLFHSLYIFLGFRCVSSSSHQCCSFHIFSLYSHIILGWSEELRLKVHVDVSHLQRCAHESLLKSWFQQQCRDSKYLWIKKYQRLIFVLSWHLSEERQNITFVHIWLIFMCL